MDDRELFRFGFLLKCAEDGLDAAGIRERASQIRRLKRAGLGGVVSGLFSPMLQLGGLQATIGAGLGVAGGYGLAKLTEEDVDPEMAKKYELIAAYRQQADRARRQAARLAYRSKAAPPRLATTFS